jgi:hypothetical protein
MSHNHTQWASNRPAGSVSASGTMVVSGENSSSSRQSIPQQGAPAAQTSGTSSKCPEPKRASLNEGITRGLNGMGLASSDPDRRLIGLAQTGGIRRWHEGAEPAPLIAAETGQTAICYTVRGPLLMAAICAVPPSGGHSRYVSTSRPAAVLVGAHPARIGAVLAARPVAPTPSAAAAAPLPGRYVTAANLGPVKPLPAGAVPDRPGVLPPVSPVITCPPAGFLPCREVRVFRTRPAHIPTLPVRFADYPGVKIGCQQAFLFPFIAHLPPVGRQALGTAHFHIAIYEPGEDWIVPPHPP